MKSSFIIIQERSCADCFNFISAHPTLAQRNITRQHKTQSGQWLHVTRNGKALHEHVVAKLTESHAGQ